MDKEKKNSEYWANRVANETWNKYNSYEEQNKNLLEFYKEAILDIEEELYRLMIKIGEKPTLTDMHDNNRLTKLKKKMEGIVKELTEKTIEHNKDQLIEAIKEQYKDVSIAIGKEDFSLPKKREMEMMLNNPWSGMNYSERVWENNRVLASNLNEILTRGLIQGKSVMDMTKELNDRMMKGFNRSHTLIRTEVMHYMNESSLKSYKDANVKEVEIYAAEDERTCEHCGSEHTKVYKIDKAPILPFHPRCRCTYLPVIKFETNKKEVV